MSEVTTVRISKVAKEFNVGINTIVDFLKKKGYTVEASPNAKLDPAMYKLIAAEFVVEKKIKSEANTIDISYRSVNKKQDGEESANETDNDQSNDIFIKNTIISNDHLTNNPSSKKIVEPSKNQDSAIINVTSDETTVDPQFSTIKGPVIIDKIDLNNLNKPKKQPIQTSTETVLQPSSSDIQATPTDSSDKKSQPIVEPATEQNIDTNLLEKQPDIIEKQPANPSSEDTDSIINTSNQVVEQPLATTQPTITPSQINDSPSVSDNPPIIETHSSSDNLSNNEQKTNTQSSKDQSVKEEKQQIKTKLNKEQLETVKNKAPKILPKSQNVQKTKSEVKPTEKTISASTEKSIEKPAEKTTSSKGVMSDDNFLDIKADRIKGPTIIKKIELPTEKPKEPKKAVSSTSDDALKKKKRKRIKKDVLDKAIVKKDDPNAPKKDKDSPAIINKKHSNPKKKKEIRKVEISDEEVKKQIHETLSNLQKGKSKSVKRRREKREAKGEELRRKAAEKEAEQSTIKVTEFVTVNELANLMNVQVTDVIKVCMDLGVIVSINQRLDAETLSVVASEFGFNIEFVGVEIHEPEDNHEDNEEDRVTRNPIVTVMGHVDHGKTSLLDYIRNTNVIAGEAGGITQHIGAYEVHLKSGRNITFLDTPGHEAFTAMRARGAQITDVVIIVVAADDKVMPQTIEAINHAQAANVPIVFAINKIDKPAADVEKIKRELSNMNILVEDWGGPYQCQEISAKKGINVDLLLDKVLLQADILDLKGNPKKRAEGTIIESALDKGRGYVAKMLVQDGTLHTGDIVLAGTCYGKVKALFNERNQKVESCGPSSPILLLGLNGAPQAGDRFLVLQDEHEAKNVANKRSQLQREMGIRTQKHITLEEIGRRIAIGDFKELNIIVKGDVDGSIEALSDSLLKLSTPEVQVNIIHKSVGQITETDVMLASASDAIIVGFQVRPSQSARKIADQEQIDIRTYSVIYKAIDEIKDAIKGMLSPEIEEKITCNVEIREVFRISKVGTIAGCLVQSGTISRNTRIRVIRDGIVVHTGKLGSLKRFKDDVKEVKNSLECGLNIDNFNDVQVGDIIEGFEEVEHQRK